MLCFLSEVPSKNVPVIRMCWCDMSLRELQAGISSSAIGYACIHQLDEHAIQKGIEQGNHDD